MQDVIKPPHQMTKNPQQNNKKIFLAGTIEMFY